ncbi:MAG: efflux RND transporter permease subunit [Desulfobacterota bacterium]|nr:efflux RND transporter permease subunit [Thermodesulfobacteriota bacterium]
MFLSDLSVRRPVVATMVIVATVFFGLLGFQRLGIDLFPQVDFPYVTVTTTLVGAAPEVMDTDVTDPIEEEINTIEGVKHITSTSGYGFSQIVVEFELYRDIDSAVQDVRAKVDLAKRRLPSDIDPPIIDKLDINAMPILWIAMKGQLPLQKLGLIADEIVKPQLESIKGVGTIRLEGYAKREIRIWLDRRRLEAHRLTPTDIARALREKNIELPGGLIESVDREFTVRNLGELRNIEEFNQLILSYQNGGPVRLKDVGWAEDGVEPLRSIARFNGIPSVGLSIVPRSGANVVEVARIVKAKLPEIQRSLPQGVEIALSFDSSTFIEEAISDVSYDVFLGGLLAAAVMIVFLLNLRTTLITAVAIPTSLISSFGIMYFMGFTRNYMTMLALSMMVGVVIDDAIIVLENCYRHMEEGKDPMRAAREGTSEIAFAAAAATFSIVAVFLPVAFMGGIIGRFFFQFGVTVATSVVASLVVALLFIPMLCSRFLRVEASHGRLYHLFHTSYERLEGRYRKALRFCLSHRWMVLLVAGLVFLGSLWILKQLKTEFVPKSDESRFIVHVEAPTGSSLQYTDERMERLEAMILGLPEVKSVFSAIGVGARKEVHKGTLMVALRDRNERERSQHEIMAALRERFKTVPGVRAYVEDFEPVALGGRRGAPLQLDLKGPDIRELEKIANQIMGEMLNLKGFVDISSDIELTKPEVRVYIDRERASDLGVDVREISLSILQMVGGQEVSKFKDVERAKRYDVRMRLIQDQRMSPDDIGQITLRTPKGGLIKLAQVVKVEEGVGPNVITRKDRQRSATLYADTGPGKTLGEAIQEAEALAKRYLPAGYSHSFFGQAEAFRESFRYLIQALIQAIVIIYIVLAMQFNSFLHPLTVMLALPLSTVGAFGALYVTGDTISIISMIGMITLTALVIKNSILLVDYTNQLRERGMEREAALLQAAPVRLRPILMTAVTTMFGVLPVALGYSAGGELRAGMGRATFGGMFASTLLTLFVIPVAYTLIDDLKIGLGKTLRGRKARGLHS